MIKVVIHHIYFDEYRACNFEGEGKTVQAALNRAKKKMLKEYPDGVFTIYYETFSQNKNTLEWHYQASYQT